jgi:ATP synthase protein I
MTREEALQWRARQPEQSAWRVVGWQMMLALAVTLVAAVLTRQAAVVWSVAYGALCILLPTVLMVYGLSSRALSRWLRGSDPARPGAALAGVFFWEGIKILFAVTLMGLAPFLIADLNWLGLLAGLVVVLKAYWLAFWLGRRKPA